MAFPISKMSAASEVSAGRIVMVLPDLDKNFLGAILLTFSIIEESASKDKCPKGRFRVLGKIGSQRIVQVGNLFSLDI